MTDAVKMAIERIKARFHPHYGIDGASDSKQLASDCQTLIAALEQAGEPGADDAREKLAGEQGEQCERCQGNGEIVTDWDRYMHAHDGDVGDEAVADCPDCSGTSRIEGEAPLPTLQRLGQEFDGEGEIERLREAIAATEYKYFGDYEMTDRQREAVDVLVGHAKSSLDASPPARLGQEGDKGLREALEWYGEQARLCRLIHSEGDAGRHALQDDGGKRARAAPSEAREAGDTC